MDTQNNNYIYKCISCEYQTNKKYNIQRHKKTCNKINTLKCEVCEYKTDKIYNYKRHIITQKT